LGLDSDQRRAQFVNIEQRHVTTINLQDGKARDFVVNREGSTCTISGVSGDEVVRLVLSHQDFHRLAHTFGQPVTSDPYLGHAVRNGSYLRGDGADGGTGPWNGIHVDRRHVTTVTLHPSRLRDFVLTQDDRGYTLTSLAREEVVTLLLSPGDYAKLRFHIGHRDDREVRPESPPSAPPVQARPSRLASAFPRGSEDTACGMGEPCSVTYPSRVEASPYVWTGIDWLGYN
jgi:hypothetical protein